MRYVQDPQWGEVYVDDASGTIYRPYSDEGGTTLGFLRNYNSDVRFDSLKPVSTPTPGFFGDMGPVFQASPSAPAPAPAPAADPFAPIPKPEWVSSSDPYWSQFGNVAGRDPESGEFTNPYISTIRGLEDVGNWRGVARQLGYQGPFETQSVSYDPGEGGGGVINVPAPEFLQFIEQKKAEGYDFVTKGDQIDRDRQTVGLMTPTGEVINQTPVKVSGFGDFFKEFVLPAVAAYGAVNFLGPRLEGLTSSLGGPGPLTATDLAVLPPEVSASSVPQASFPPIESKITPVSTPAAAATDAAKAVKLGELTPLQSIMQVPTAPAPSSAPIFDLGGNAIDPFTSEILSPASVVPAAASAVGSANVSRGLLYGKEAYGPGMTGAQTAAYDSILGLTGSKTLADLAGTATGLTTNTTDLKDLAKSAIGIGKDVLSSRAGLAGLGALLSYFDKQPPRGGGYTGVAAAPTPMTRTMVQGAYGPIARYAANGGLMQAYAQGGVVTGTHQRPMQMEDGGFVMTKKAVDGAGGPRGIAQLLPDAKLIQGPGTGTSDDIPATIEGSTPARVSNGEMYVPRAQVKQAGGAPALYALMNKLQRRA